MRTKHPYHAAQPIGARSVAETLLQKCAKRLLHRLFPVRVPHPGNETETADPGFMSRTANSVAWKRLHGLSRTVPFFFIALSLMVLDTARGDIYINATESGGNTTVTIDGSYNFLGLVTTTNPGTSSTFINPGTGALGFTGPSDIFVPASAAFEIPTFSFGPGSVDSAATSLLATNPFIGFFGYFGIVDLYQNASLTGTLNGAATFSGGINANGIDLTPQTIVFSNGEILYLFNGFPPIPGVPVAAAGSTSKPVTIPVTNIGAILSAETTGLNSMSTTLSGVQNAAQNAVGDLNNRIFNARSGGAQDGNGGGIASTLDSGTSCYLNFAQNQNIDYRVALGLADGEEVDIVDTLSGAGHPLAMVGVPAVTGSAVIAVEGGSGKNSVTDKVVIEDVADTKFEVFTSFDYGYYDQDNLTRTVRGFETDTYAGSAGLEYDVTDWLVAGAAFTYVNSDTTSTAKLGSSDLEGNLLSGYATLFHGNTYLDVLYSYGDFDNDISRNTLLGRTAYGDTESQSHNIDLNLGHTIHMNERFSFGPSAGLNYTTGEVDGYTERNGGLANLIYPDHDFESMIGRLGGYATYKCDTAFGLLTNQFSAGWAHEFMPENGNVTASLETSPFALVTGNNIQSIGNYTASEERAHTGTDWLELGVTSRLDIKNTDFNVQLGYQGMFGRNNASGHFGSAKIGYEW